MMLNCPGCGRITEIADDSDGQSLRCPDCDVVLSVPVSGSPVASAVPTGPTLSEIPLRRTVSVNAAATTAPSRIKLPATFLCLVCGLSILVTISALFKQPLPPADAAAQQGNPQAPAARAGQILGYVSAHAYFILRDIILIFACTRMLALRSFGFAKFGAIVSIVPCCGSPCFVAGIPFGIWALVVLNDPAVKSAFR